MLDEINALAKEYAGKHFRYFIHNIRGITETRLRLGSRFKLSVYRVWMGSEAINDKMSGSVIKTNNPNVTILKNKNFLFHLITFAKSVKFDLNIHAGSSFGMSEIDAILLTVKGIANKKYEAVYLKLI